MNIALFCGGFSSEREISFKSAKSVYNEIKNSIPLIPIDTGRAEIFTDFDTQMKKEPSTPSLNTTRKLLSILDKEKIDFVFLMLHGAEGEDGHIQALLDLCNIPYTGSKMGASYIGMNKIISKYIMEYFGIPTPFWLSVKKGDNISDIEADFQYPLIVKPAKEGSTVGLYKVDNIKQLHSAIEKALEFDDEILIEEFIDGREFSITVMENRVYPIVEIVPKSGLYDYESKYTKGKSEYICPAKLSEEIKENVEYDALQLYDAMNLKGVVRFDFRLKNDKYFFLEVNTLPGMTSLSLVPMSFKAKGISYKELIERILNGTVY